MKSLLFVLSLFFASFRGNAQLYFSQVNDSTFREGVEIMIYGIRFPFDGPPFCEVEENIATYDSIIRLFEAHPGMKATLYFHTDSRGSADKNLEFSQKRADAIKTCLVQKGIRSEQIIAVGKGESNPVVGEAEINAYKQTDPKKFEMLHQRNRRTVMRVVSQ